MHYISITVFKDMTPSNSNFDLAVAWLAPHHRLRVEINQLATEVMLVLQYILIKGQWEMRIVPHCHLHVVIHEVDMSC